MIIGQSQGNANLYENCLQHWMNFYSKLYRKRQAGWPVLLRLLGIVTGSIFCEDAGTGDERANRRQAGRHWEPQDGFIVLEEAGVS